MFVSNHGKQAGKSPRQPHCGKCCGEHTARGSAKNKRADRRTYKLELRMGKVA